MNRSADTTTQAHEAQLQAWRRMGAARRLELALQMSEDVREISRAGFRARHPEYTESQVLQAERFLWLGRELASLAWPAVPYVAP